MQPILLTPSDQSRLERLLDALDGSDRADPRVVDALAHELAHARVVEEEDLPPDVVTTGARVTVLDIDSNERLVYELVYPEQADLGAGRVSVLAPMGLALIGTRVGQEVQWPTSRGYRRARIESVERLGR